MEKRASVDHEVHPLIQRRWSPRAFSPRAVEAPALRSLLEAARWAASCFNEQPWRFLVATQEDAAEHQRMLACLAPSNQVWAKDAPVLMLSVASLHFERNGKPNRTAQHDVGLAVAQLTLQATSMGLFVHQMAGFDAEMARRTYGIPDGYEPIAAIAVGYLGDPSALPEGLRERETQPGVRKPQSDLVFSGAWAKAFPEG